MNFINLSSTASTLLITLYSRASMSKKGIIINDKKAEEIIQLTGYNSKKLKVKKSHEVFLTIRAKLIDDYTKEFIDKYNGECTVIQIACGLDSRYLRLNNDKVKWYDLDIYATIQIRKKYYKETKNYKMIESNVLNFTWINKIDKEDRQKPTLIICEGLFMYLSENDNKKIFSTLPQYFHNTNIVFDAFSKFEQTLSPLIGALKRTNAKFQFGFTNPKIIENMSDQIKYVNYISYHKNKYIKELSLYYQIKYFFKKLFMDKSQRIEVFHIN